MKAYVRTNAQSMEVELQDIAVPEVAEQEVLVEMSAFGVGIHDRYFIPSDANFPYTIGLEGSGVIKKIGNGVRDFVIGDRVILNSSSLPKGGCWAEYTVVPSDMLIFLPESMDFNEGATISVAGKTAMECMGALDLNEGDTLFIAGASGAIGSLVIQLAVDKGVRVIASASKNNHAYMHALGADITVDYKDADWQESLLKILPNGVDIALAIQPNTAKDSMDVVKNSGTVITVSGDSIAAERGITVSQFEHLLSWQEALNGLIGNITAGKVKIIIEKIYRFDQALEALAKTETRHARGKIVVSI
ncbi:NADP-dependent oxidoreductase [Psychrobacter sp. DAB_AL32B]|uniref:NADP-dependent oxidoreductase n=1 Tax=Psychrobacter sp. DAB_AL32B TaxID=1028414 RepID=UPI000B7F4520|nr:NADP-dependent oxidoreductase [Psychrobacter sp. DAB_AL32B]OXL27050.1 quinone oxidoreductase [Psychrobacter sp. DAB_AL32B]